MQCITQKQAREIDDSLLSLGFTIESLIEIAGLCAYEVLADLLPREFEKKELVRILVLIGPGSNGGDGLVISRYLHMSGYKVVIYCHRTKHTSLLRICQNLGMEIIQSVPENVGSYSLVIDALFGFSYKAPLRMPYSLILERFKESERIISIDVPTSYDVDRINEKKAFIAFCVICFLAPKPCCEDLKVYVTRSFVSPSLCGHLRNLNYGRYICLEPFLTIDLDSSECGEAD
jgi:NAD(P)H-hydrate epimerase